MRISTLLAFVIQSAFCAVLAIIVLLNASSRSRAPVFELTQRSMPVYSDINSLEASTLTPASKQPITSPALQSLSDYSLRKIVDFPSDMNSPFSVVTPFHNDGLNVLLVSNACVRLGSDYRMSQIIYYNKNKTLNHSIMATSSDGGFYYGQNRQWQERIGEPAPLPEDATWHDELTMLIRPPWPAHIGHFWDGIGALWYFVHHPQHFPWLQRLRTLAFIASPAAELQYNTALTSIIIDQLQAIKAPHNTAPILAHDDVWYRASQSTLHCFREAVIPGMMMTSLPQRVGGVFASVADAEATRSIVYESINASTPRNARSERIRVVFLDRCPSTRCITNHEEILLQLQRSRMGTRLDFFDWVSELGLSGKFNASRGNFGELSFAEQVLVSRHADIILGLHGSGMVNAVFMETNSVLIEIKPLALLEPVFYAFAVSSGQAYMYSYAMNTTNCLRGPVSEDCLKDPYDFNNYSGDMARFCSQVPKFCSFTLSSTEVQAVLRNVFHATQEVLTRKRRFSLPST